MTTRRNGIYTALLAITMAGLGSYPATAQIPDKFTNLKVLPKGITKPDLQREMVGFSFALGVRCVYCHVGEDSPDLHGVDFASDEKDAKRNARVMLRMVQKINDKLMSDLKTGRNEKVRVECVTCHHALPIPRKIEDVIADSIASHGVEAAVAEYRKLREKNYGGFAYDFTVFPLNGLAGRLMRTGKLDDALAIAGVNMEYNSGSPRVYSMAAEIYRVKGDKEKAIENFKKALEIQPENAFVLKRLEELTKPGKP